MGEPGRKTLLTKRVHDKAVSMRAVGLPWTVIESAVGVSTTNMENWRRDGKELLEAINDGKINEEDLTDNEVKYLNFYKDTAEAIAGYAEDTHRIFIDNRGMTQLWRTLKMNFPEDYADHTDVHIKHSSDKALEFVEGIVVRKLLEE